MRSRVRPARTAGAPLLIVACFGLLAAPLDLEAQGRKTATVCYLAYAPSPSHDEAFFQGLRDLGYSQGRNVAIHTLSADGRFDRFPGIVDECIRRKPDVIVALTTPGALAAKKATSTIPIVSGPTGDPVATGIVASLARPGANVTGVTQMGPGLTAKRLELLKQALPRLSKISILANRSDPVATSQLQELQRTAERLGIQTRVHDVQNPQQLEEAVAAAARHKDEALITTIETIFLVQRARLVELATKHRLPVMSPYREVAEAGALLSYGPNRPALYRRMAVFVDKILKGASPGDLPVEQASEFELVVNLKTAAAFGESISPSFLLRADHVIR